MLDVQKLRAEFPILNQAVNGKPLVYLDNAATSQKPKAVLDALQTYYGTMNANVHRGVHSLAEKATSAFEETRGLVADFIGATDLSEVIFTRGTTESVNMVAYGWGDLNVNEGDEVVVSIVEHHSNLVPWQELCRRKGAVLKFIRLGENYELDPDGLNGLISNKTKMVAITAMSNALGSVTDLAPIIARAHEVGARVLVDGAQSVPHFGADVQKMGADFFVFSAHKMLGPTGVGALWAKRALLEEMQPMLFGGEMIGEVSEQTASWNEVPAKFEAGTPNIAGVIGFGEASKFLNSVGMSNIKAHSTKLAHYAIQELSKVNGVRIYSPKERNGGIVSFTMDGVHPHDIGSILDNEGVAIRAGHHCAQPLMESLNVPALARMSFYLYNTEQEVDSAVEAVKKVKSVFKI